MPLSSKTASGTSRRINALKKSSAGIVVFLSLLASAGAKEWSPSEWPALKHYDSGHLQQIALPLGGIGTGTVSLGGRGELRDWEIMNVPAKGYSTVTPGNNAPFFAINIKGSGGTPVSALLCGPLYDNEYLHYEGRPVNHHGLPRFSSASFDAAYPFGQVNLSDDDLPVEVRIKGFNPLIPGNAEDSGMPIAVLSYEVTNVSDSTVTVSVCGSMRNFIGKDGSKHTSNWKGDFIPTGASKNKNEYRQQDGLCGIYMYSEGVDINDPAWGTMALTTEAVEGVSWRTSSVRDRWSNAILDFWDDFSTDGVLEEKKQPSGEDDPMASLAVSKVLAPGQTKTYTFFITWNFPNRKAWSESVVGNYYSTVYKNAWNAAETIIPRMEELEEKTLSFVNAVLSCSYPDVIKEAALFNLAVLRSQTVMRLPDGHMMGWEGVMDRFGSCPGSCTHVWNYEVATPFLFGELARSMRDVELNYATRKDSGLMNFRASLPLSKAAEGKSAAADGQMGCIMKMYREWQLSGDNNFLSSNWDMVKKALAYAWTEGGWDGNMDGVMEGSQHNTMDVNYFGPNPQMAFWYLGALRAAEEMAEAMDDTEFAGKCRELYRKGSRWIDKNLFNGEYYEQMITDPKTFEFIDMDDPDTVIPPYQLGRGCLVDQLAGQYMAHICGLGYLADKDNIRTTLKSIMKYNYIDDFSSHFCNMRSYVMGDESGLVMASWPKGRLKVPFPYFAESMTGFEYCAAVGMKYEGMDEEALKCIGAIRSRFDGARRNPFSEPECGHHYARSMASWAAILAWSGYHYSGISKEMEFTGTPGRYFWSNGESWGTCDVSSCRATITVIHGSLELRRITIGGKHMSLDGAIIGQGDSRTVDIR